MHRHAGARWPTARLRSLLACRPRLRSRTLGTGRACSRTRAQHDVVRCRAHERVITADPRLAFRPVQQSLCAPPARAEYEFGRGWKAGTPEPGDAGFAHTLNEPIGIRARQCLPRGRTRSSIASRAVALDHDADAAPTLVGGFTRLDRNDCAGKRRMQCDWRTDHRRARRACRRPPCRRPSRPVLRCTRSLGRARASPGRAAAAR